MAAQAITDPDLGVKGGSPAPIDVGNGGTMAVGTTTKRDGRKSKASVLFTEGRVFVDLEFESPPNDPVPPDFALDVGAQSGRGNQERAAGLKSRALRRPGPSS
ncbi:MAG TPA: hypothetical protein VME67_14435 [Mycobacterium sp.]|nr:hypothetical protein [Mycobacterium sp.]HTX95943.1 hypothetical protein [Mycobacterium sp.]